MSLVCAPLSMMLLKYDTYSLEPSSCHEVGIYDPPLEPRQSSKESTVGSEVTSETKA